MSENARTHQTVNAFLPELAAQLARFLDRVLPQFCGKNWWREAVLDKLTEQQRRQIKQRGVERLDGLDLAALLRVLDQNWYRFEDALRLSRDDRNYVKEMQNVRNRWAHAGADGIDTDDIYRDLDTMRRLARVIGADEAFLGRLQEAKAAALRSAEAPEPAEEAAPAPPAPEPEPPEPEPAPEPEPEPTPEPESSNAPEFTLGQMVRLKAQPERQGVVMNVAAGSPENRYTVFMDNAPCAFYASQLEAVAPERPDIKILPAERFHAALTALQLRQPGLSTLYSLHAARVDFIPYQFRPVLRFIRSDRPRLLIADSVGVGKTIEAGFILRELQARREVGSVLIVCPRPLVAERKWEREMKRFDETFIPMNGDDLRYCLDECDLEGAWPERYQKIILPYSLFDEDLLHGSPPKKRGKRKTGLLALDPPPRFDLVIVDEAHHIRNPATFRHQAVRFFCDNAEAVLFLTATPVQMGDRDLFVLLNALRPDLVIDPQSFAHMAEPNPHINRAVDAMRGCGPNWRDTALEALGRAGETDWGRAMLRRNPVFQNARAALEHPEITPEERVRLIAETENLHTFSGIINRTRRRDIGDFTTRRPETVEIPFTPAQQRVHDELLRLQAEIYYRAHGGANVGFMMTTIRRQAASCLFGLAPFLRDILHRRLGDLELEESEEGGIDEGGVETLRGDIERLIAVAESLKDADDPKLAALLRIIRGKQAMPNRRVMLFSGFRHTLNYLHKKLAADGLRVGLMHGGTPDAERLALRERFAAPPAEPNALDIMLFSEIGCEGLDYQFCDCMVNYDLPWNPMRIEQRIGRIDRNGQKSESVLIHNFITPGTVDAAIYHRCLFRIGVFHGAVGGSEEILGDITNKIREIAEDYKLTPVEREDRLRQLADNEIRKIQEQEALEEQQRELFGIRLPRERLEREIEDASSFWLGPAFLRRLVELYLLDRCGAGEHLLGEKPLKTLRLSKEAREALLADSRALPRQRGEIRRAWERRLKEGDQYMAVTFDAECAAAHPEAAFIIPTHPLAQQAARAMPGGGRAVAHLSARAGDVPPGAHLFAIYQWRFSGLREDVVLQPVAESPEVTAALVRLLEGAEDCAEPLPEDVDAHAWDALDARHHALWSEARERHLARNREMVGFRRESLEASHCARVAQLEEIIGKVRDEKILKMRRAQLEAAKADFERRMRDFDEAAEQAELTFEPVAYGLIHIAGGTE